MSLYKKKKKIKNYQKFYKNHYLKTSFKSICVCKELTTNSIGKMKFLKQAIFIRYVLTNMIDRYVLKGPGTSFQVTFFAEFFDKKDYFVILHKLIKFHCQTVHSA